MKTLLTVTCAIVFCGISFGRPVAYWPYDKLTKESDLIAIATPIAVNDTGEKTTFPGIQRDNHPVPAIGMETTFEILSVLKGEKGSKEIILYHLREEVLQTISVNGPALVSFDSKKKSRYLLFLKRDKDGRYSPLTGQTDPDGSVKDLGTYP